jgi:hypothetical protein
MQILILLLTIIIATYYLCWMLYFLITETRTGSVFIRYLYDRDSITIDKFADFLQNLRKKS